MKFNSQYRILILLLSIFIQACHSSKSYDATTIGELENLIKKGDMTTHIKMNSLENKPNLYAIGSVTNLKGFIVVDDSRPFTTYVAEGGVAIDSSWNTEATLFVYAQVKGWKEISIPSEINDWKKLEDFVMQQAEENQINPDLAFPFLLKGDAESISWRVSDWDAADKVVTNKKVKNSGVKGTASQVTTKIVGFYCTKQYRVLAEHDTKMHLHFVSDDRKTSGHVDDITLSGNMKLFLPLEEDDK